MRGLHAPWHHPHHCLCSPSSCCYATGTQGRVTRQTANRDAKWRSAEARLRSPISGAAALPDGRQCARQPRSSACCSTL